MTRRAGGLQFAALLLGNLALALGPWAVRRADCGPISAAFWRLALAAPVLALLALANRQRLRLSARRGGVVALSGVLFAADLASWHIGVARTRLGNATLFGNCGALVLMVWGVIAARRAPTGSELAALAASLAGSALLLGGSIEISAVHLSGDLYSITAGLFYAFYILLLQRVRAEEGAWALLAGASAAGAPALLAVAILRGERVVPHDWWPVLLLALGSQIIGQGLLIYALRYFSSLVIALTLLSQPVVTAAIGWAAFGERLGGWDVLGMALLGAALVLVRAREPATVAPELDAAPAGQSA